MSSEIDRAPMAELGSPRRCTGRARCVFCRILAMCELARQHLDGGDLDAARLVFTRAEALVEERVARARRAGLAGPGRDVLAVAEGDLEDARRWAEQVDDSFWSGVSWRGSDLAAGDRSAAMAALDTATPRCVRHEVVRRCSRRVPWPTRDEAMKYASTAVELASVERPAADGRRRGRRGHRAGRARRVARPAGVARPPAASRRRRHRVAERPPVPGSIEPLTERERDVLRFLPSRLTVREIADELYVSVEHGEVPPAGHLPKARRQLSSRSRRGRRAR